MVRMLRRVGRALPWTAQRGRASVCGDTSGCPVDGVEVVGFIRSEIGIGQAARLLHHAMESARIPLSVRDLPIPGRAGDRSLESTLSGWLPRRVSVMVTATGFPVACRLIPVRRGEYPAWRGQQWAEPSVDHAAELLRSIDVDRASAAERGRIGRAWMTEHHSPVAVGRTIRSWLTAHGWLREEASWQR